MRPVRRSMVSKRWSTRSKRAFISWRRSEMFPMMASAKRLSSALRSARAMGCWSFASGMAFFGGLATPLLFIVRKWPANGASLAAGAGGRSAVSTLLASGVERRARRAKDSSPRRKPSGTGPALLSSPFGDSTACSPIVRQRPRRLSGAGLQACLRRPSGGRSGVSTLLAGSVERRARRAKNSSPWRKPSGTGPALWSSPSQGRKSLILHPESQSLLHQRILPDQVLDANGTPWIQPSQSLLRQRILPDTGNRRTGTARSLRSQSLLRQRILPDGFKNWRPCFEG